MISDQSGDHFRVPPMRMHPAGFAIVGLKHLFEAGRAIVPIFAIYVLGASGKVSTASVISAALVAATIVRALVVWLTTRFAVTQDSVTFRRRSITLTESAIPLRRVQSVDLHRGPLQRLFGVVAVTVRTAAGDESAIVLPAVSASVAEQIRAAVGTTTDASAPTDARANPSRTLSTKRLVLAGVSGSRIGFVIAAGLALYRFDDKIGVDVTKLLPADEPSIVVAVLAILVAAWLIGIVVAAFVFGDFTIERDGARLHSKRGYVSQSQATIPVARIHAISIEENVLRRPLGFAAIRVEVAGYGTDSATEETLFPLLHRSEIDPFLQQLVPEFATTLPPLAKLSRRALPRFVSMALGAAIVACVLVLLFWPSALILAPLLVVAAPFVGWARWRGQGWAIDEQFIALRSGALGRSTLICPLRRTQHHTIWQNPLQRRAGLANLSVHVGANASGTIHQLEDGVAWRLWLGLRDASAA